MAEKLDPDFFSDIHDYLALGEAAKAVGCETDALKSTFAHPRFLDIYALTLKAQAEALNSHQTALWWEIRQQMISDGCTEESIVGAVYIFKRLESGES